MDTYGRMQIFVHFMVPGEDGNVRGYRRQVHSETIVRDVAEPRARSIAARNSHMKGLEATWTAEPLVLHLDEE